MHKYIIYLTLGFFIISCGNEPQKKISSDNTSGKIEETNENVSIGNSNYAVVWKWATEDEEKVTNSMESIAKEMTKLWEDGKAENFYYNAQSQTDKFSYFPNIVFTLKAKNKEDAETELNRLKIVKKGIATYIIYPVGQLWLKRNNEALKKNGLTKSYVAVWNSQNKDYSDEQVKSQNDKVMELWNKGKIENAYFDIEGTQLDNEVTDFVFFVNANSEEEAKEICNSLPFSKENIASYSIHEVGVFFLGQTK